MNSLSASIFPLSKLGELVYDPKSNRWGKLIEVYRGLYGEYDRERDLDPPEVYFYQVCFVTPNHERHRNNGRLRLSWECFPAWEIVKGSLTTTAPNEASQILDEVSIIARKN